MQIKQNLINKKILINKIFNYKMKLLKIHQHNKNKI